MKTLTPRVRLATSVLLSFGAVCLAPSSARAQATGPSGAPPAEAKALVEGPKKVADEPQFEDKVDGTTIAVAAGGMWSTGNSRQAAASASGAWDSRFSNNGVGASLLGNYGQGAAPGAGVRVTAENVQGRARYDRYVIESASVFVIETGRHDRFQGLDFRENFDLGFKYLFLRAARSSLWAEIGYDLQHDIRRDADRGVVDATGAAVLDPTTGTQEVLSKTQTDHSTRLFVGFKHAFNKEVTLATGLEYLQSVVDTTRYRMNADALFAAKVGGGLALGVGFSARYDHAPLPLKENLDTASTLNLIYAFSDAPESDGAAKCPCPAPSPEPPPEAPAPAPAPPAPTPPAPTPPAPTPAPAPEGVPSPAGPL